MKYRTLSDTILVWFILVFCFSGVDEGHLFAREAQPQRSKPYTTYNGIVLDAQHQTPVVFAAIIISGTSSGTVTNTEGRFIIKIPDSIPHPSLIISSLGYVTRNVDLSELSASETNTIVLEAASIPIEPIIIRNINPEDILREAIKKIPENFGNSPMMMTGFYRESIRKNKSYKSVGEAILDIYKGSYKNYFDKDRIQLYKGRKSEDLRKSDTIMVKFMGGPVTASLLDLVKNPSDILSPAFFNYYDFSFAGVLLIDNHETYIIHFDQKDTVSIPLYKGDIYIDSKSKAFVSIDFEISPKKIEKAAEFLVLRKPSNMDVEVINAHYLVNYRMENNRWFLNYVRLEDHFSIKWGKRLFRSEYYLTSETAITDIIPGDITKPKFRESFRRNDFFSEEVNDLEDPEFWGAANVIEPEAPIQEAILKISKHLKKREE